mmetsp:Transcript_26303/g.88417  ORF Transcript_26303/g.88417 Transcript_26303/m.88417 type:complete len:511 (+) Transcript_26303:64-1596(+)
MPTMAVDSLRRRPATVDSGRPGGPCAVCLGTVSQPIRLACGHAFCNKCLARCASHDIARCPTCRREHLLDPVVLLQRLAAYRRDYGSWRQGRSKGSVGEVGAIRAPAAQGPEAEVVDACNSFVNCLTAPAPNTRLFWKLSGAAFEPPAAQKPRDDEAAAAAQARAEEAAVVLAYPSKFAPGEDEAAAALALFREARPSVRWLATMLMVSPETLVVSALATHAFLAAAAHHFFTPPEQREPAIWAFLLFGAFVAAVAGPAGKARVDARVGKVLLGGAIKRAIALECIGVVALAYGAVRRVWLWPCALFGVAICTQGGQLFRVQRKTTGARPHPHVAHHLALLALTAYAHHIGSFIRVPNVETAMFVAAWRFVSITTHCLEFLDERFGLSDEFFKIYGWTRYVLCVLCFQPAAILAVFAGVGAFDGYAGPLDGAVPWLAAVGRGLAANSTGHAAYAVFRGCRMWDTVYVRLLGRPGRTNPRNTAGRQYPYLELEVVLLFAFSATVLLAPRLC